jgi:hypothetical protein
MDKYFQKMHNTISSEDFHKSLREKLQKSTENMRNRIRSKYINYGGSRSDPPSDEENKIIDERINDLVTIQNLENQKFLYHFKKNVKKKKDKVKKDFNQFVDDVVFSENDVLIKSYTKIADMLFINKQTERYINNSAKLLYLNKDNDEHWVRIKEDIKSRTDRFNEENKKDGKLVLNSSTNNTTTSKGEEKVNESSDETTSQSTTETNATSTGTEGFVNIDDSIKFKKILFILIIVVFFLHLFTDFKIF